ncbi:MAG: hypothetical protein ACI9CV_001627, partial [Ilumatobacter sp.]
AVTQQNGQIGSIQKSKFMFVVSPEHVTPKPVDV